MTANASFQLTTPAFTHGGVIPTLYTCDGQDISPPLAWTEAPKGTQSFVLICDDPDAPGGTWDHWLLFNIPPSFRHLPQQATALPPGVKGGKNSWGRNTYGGPCPPDRTHRYFFKLYALDTMLDLESGASKQDIERAMQDHILATAELMGRYDRQR